MCTRVCACMLIASVHTRLHILYIIQDIYTHIMYMHMYTHICLFRYTYMCIRLYISLCLHKYKYKHLHTHKPIHQCLHVCACVYLFATFVDVPVYVCYTILRRCTCICIIILRTRIICIHLCVCAGMDKPCTQILIPPPHPSLPLCLFPTLPPPQPAPHNG